MKSMYMKYFIRLFFLLQFIGMHSSGQEVADTIVLGEVTIFQAHIEYFSDGAKQEMLDSSFLHLLPLSTLSDVLQHATPALLKSYGSAGAAATISLRGAGASRSQVLWEGVPINSSTMGQSDVSLIPSTSFNTIAIDHSGAGTQYGSGSFGGAINLSHSPRWKKQNSYVLHLSNASFQTYNTYFQHTLGNNTYELKGTYFFDKSQGNFTYFDYILQDTLTRINADHNTYGFLQNFNYKPSNSIVCKAGVWYHVKNAHLPAIMGSYPYNHETQLDSTFKVFVQAQKTFSSSMLTFTNAWFDSYQIYTKKLRPTDSVYFSYNEIRTKQLYSSLKYRVYQLGPFTNHTEFQYMHSAADVPDYELEHAENIYSFINALRFTRSKIRISASVRKDILVDTKIPFLYTLGVSYHPSTLLLVFRATSSKKYRRPTFNDLYWREWGNPDLLPEYGTSHEVGVQSNMRFGKTHSVLLDACTFYSSINDMIMWVPVGALWRPMNVSQSVLQGFEFRVHHSYQTAHNITFQQKIDVDLHYSHIVQFDTDANNDLARGHQLYYVPRVSLNYAPGIEYKQVKFGVMCNHQSKRYYGINKILPAYTVFNAYIHISVADEKIPSVMKFSVKNITNLSYEHVRSYPLPGRSFEFGITFLIN